MKLVLQWSSPKSAGILRFPSGTWETTNPLREARLPHRRWSRRLLYLDGHAQPGGNDYIHPYRQRKINSETANGTTSHASKTAIGAPNWPRLIPCSMLPRSASMAAVSGRARTSG